MFRAQEMDVLPFLPAVGLPALSHSLVVQLLTIPAGPLCPNLDTDGQPSDTPMGPDVVVLSTLKALQVQEQSEGPAG